MSGGERVEDTRTLQPGDRVRVAVEGVVTHVGADDFYIDHGRGGEPWSMPMPLPSAERRRSLDAWYLHDQPGTTVHRLPKPLPPEPPPGSQIVDAGYHVWTRDTDQWAVGWWIPPGDGGGGLTWRDLLSENGPVRLLGDPIEAPQ